MAHEQQTSASVCRRPRQGDVDWLVIHAREPCRGKRGGACALPLEFSPAESAAVVAVAALAQFDPRYFGGMSVEETAAALGVHPSTVIRDWGLAKAWLKRELSREEKLGG